MFTLANRSSQLMETFFGLIRDTLRPGVVAHDVSLVFELVAALKFSTPERTAELRDRYLTVILDGLRAGDAGNPGNAGDLPGPPPAWTELTERWVPAG
jgi:hypothetical protein